MIAEEWYHKSITEALAELKVTERGLDNIEVEKRQKTFGPNKLAEGKPKSHLTIFLEQFKSPLIYVLLIASIIVYLIGEIADSLIILFVLIFNAVIGTLQEGKSQNALLALKEFSATSATVIREGKETIVTEESLVPGDIVVIREGEKIPADLRVIFSNTLKVNEAALTGESIPVHKTSEDIKRVKVPIPEQMNMLFKGSFAVYGIAKALVVATGEKTELGKISKEIASFDTEIPLKKNIRSLAKIIIGITVAISTVLFFVGIAYGHTIKEMFATSVSLTVSLVPEGLPVVMTLVLATGVWRMSKKNALVKKLQAVEALGQTDVLALDKTGTITKNEIVVEKVYVNGQTFDISGDGYSPIGEVRLNGKLINPLDYEELILAGRASAFCATAELAFLEDTKTWKVSGDPTEAALAVFAKKIGFDRESIDEESPRIGEIPFDYKNKYHATLHRLKGKNFLTVAGAPEKVISLSSKLWQGGKSKSLTAREKKRLELEVIKFSKEGYRLIAFGYKSSVAEMPSTDKIPELTFGGFFVMADAIRPEVKKSIELIKIAGIRPIMITGDHKLTAESIARSIGILEKNQEVIIGSEIEEMSISEIARKLESVSVFARVTPEHKLKIIQAYKSARKIVAMTGDGVNDVPPLIAADLGVAMGKIGTEVTKEASDIVLLDDNLNSIVEAVSEGRNIFQTIKKVILYLFSTGAGEAITIIAALFIGLPLPLLPAQIIWLNLVTDSFQVIALALEPRANKITAFQKDTKNKNLLSREVIGRILVMGVPMAIGTLVLFSSYLEFSLEKALTMSLTTLAIFQWFNAWNCRSPAKSVFRENPLTNKPLILTTAGVFLLQILAVYTPFFQKILGTTSLSLSEWLLAGGIAFSVVIAEEIRKTFLRLKQRRSGYLTAR